MAESLAATVERLLRASRAAHDRAKMARHQNERAQATVELTAARDLRAEAHALDPEHASPYWLVEIPNHDTMTGFYLKQLGSA